MVEGVSEIQNVNDGRRGNGELCRGGEYARINEQRWFGVESVRNREQEGRRETEKEKASQGGKEIAKTEMKR